MTWTGFIPGTSRLGRRWFPTMYEGSQTMLDEPRRRRRAPDLETNTAPDLLHDDLRRRDQLGTPPDSVPSGEERKREDPAGGRFSPYAAVGQGPPPTPRDVAGRARTE